MYTVTCHPETVGPARENMQAVLGEPGKFPPVPHMSTFAVPFGEVVPSDPPDDNSFRLRLEIRMLLPGLPRAPLFLEIAGLLSVFLFLATVDAGPFAKTFKVRAR